VYAGETKIRRHVKIRRDANPFDPQWQPYFTERAFRKKSGLTRRKAEIKTVVKPAPLTRGFGAA
jgi:RNA-directed DNA polymerase